MVFTNVNRPSAVDVLRPFAVGDQFYADTTSTLAKRTIGSTNDVYTVVGGVPVWSSTITISTLTAVDSGFNIVGNGDPTKKLNFQVDTQGAGFTFTEDVGAQTASRTATYPVLTGNSIYAMSNATFTTTRVPFATTNGILTDSANFTFSTTVLNIANTTAASASTNGSLTVGNGTAATNVGIGGGLIYAGTRVVGVSAPSGVYGIETSTGIRGDKTSTNTSGEFAYDYRRIAGTSVSGAHNARAQSGSLYGTIASGQTNSGMWTGIWTEVIRNYTVSGDTGTLTTMEGQRISIGHLAQDASTPTTTTIKGLYIIGYRSTGTIGTMYGQQIDLNGTTGATPTTGYGLRIENVPGTTAYAIDTGTGLVRFGDTTDATSSSTGSFQTSGGLNVAKNILARQGSGKGLASTATAAATTTLTNASAQIQIFTGATTQTLQLPAANLFGANIAVEYIVINRSTGTVTAQRAGSDTFDGGGTTDAILTNTTRHYLSNGSNQWHTVA